MESMIDKTTQSSYDEVPYPELSHASSHPDRLATMATLFGMRAPPVDRCRVLELGCASGGNLIPIAYGLPESDLVGIDNSARQIAEGQKAVAALGLKNITFKHLDILDVDADLGQFDYIIAHGVFSWVSQPVQERALEICKQNLAEDGVAYVSYNTYPGWHMLGVIRDMMLYHTRGLTDPQMRASRSRQLLKFLAEAVPSDESAYGSFLNMYAKFLQGEIKGASFRGDAFLLHDELEEVNEPIFFHQFAERAARHGLQYLAEAEFCQMTDSRFSRRVSETLRHLARNVVEMEQYLDFMCNRTFRRTLLCHDDITLNRTLKPAHIRAFHIASRAQPVASQPDIHSRAVEKFQGSDGAVLSTDHPITKAGMLCLAEIWPQAVPFDTVLSMARSRLGMEAEATEEDAHVLGVNLLTAYGYSGNLIEFHLQAPHFVSDASERPVASLVARFQAQSSSKVTNMCHVRVRLDELDRYLLGHLDGCHDRAALVECLMAGPVAEGALTVQDNGEPLQGGGEVREAMAEEVEQKLRWLARAALLVA